MQSILRLLVLGTATLLSSSASAGEKRTDGPPGSEYGDFSWFEEQLQVGAQFGAMIHTRSSKSSFALGADVDYRPFEVFGFRLTYQQGIQKPRASLISTTPLIHTEFSNLRPYAFFGPGIAIVNYNDTTTKFAVVSGAGADFMLTDRVGMGMLWSYHAILDSTDVHALTARFLFAF